MTRLLFALAHGVGLPLAMGGCALTAGATAGAIAGSELEEDDGEFDPGENTDMGQEISN